MAIIDIILGVILLIFVITGYRSGFVKKIIGIICLVLALVLATKYAADVHLLLFENLEFSARTGFFISFTIIVLAVTFMQSIIYKVFIKDLVDAMWNNILGMFMGIFEGAIAISIALIIMSIYLNIPSQEAKADSQLYKPLKNFSPMVFDHVNTFLPESEDFYHQIMNFVSDTMKSMEKK